MFKFGVQCFLWPPSTRLTPDPSLHRPLCCVSMKRTAHIGTTGPMKLHLIDTNLGVLADTHHRLSSYITNSVSREFVYTECTILVWFPLDCLVTWWSGFINLFVKLKAGKKNTFCYSAPVSKTLEHECTKQLFLSCFCWTSFKKLWLASLAASEPSWLLGVLADKRQTFRSSQFSFLISFDCINRKTLHSVFFLLYVFAS